MRVCLAILLVLASPGLRAFAGQQLVDEKFPVLRAGGQTYSNVTVTAVSDTDIYFFSHQGMGNAKLKDLDPALQRHFHYKASAAEQSAASAYHFRVDSAAHAPASDADAKIELHDAVVRVREIINQPVTALPRTPDMEPDIATYPGWFHPGARLPIFNEGDVHLSQDFPYIKDKYVTSPLNPGVVFVGSELEYNYMLKYFYTDRSIPKKRLTDAEMTEINRLYRIIADDLKRLGLEKPE